ncbi:MAG: MMPL family transporter [Planctomycetes bacterium]|nr:MMPL family transporter [Planctomycetota bacterium]MBL7044240.1 MMPL family transporter [Pirellulaceae bacterium]
MNTSRFAPIAIDLFFRYRVAISIIAGAFTLVACYGVTQLSINDNLADIFKADNPDYRRLEQFFDEFGADDNECVVVLQSDDLFSRESVAVIRRLVDGLAALPDVDRVQSILDVRRPAPGVFRRIQIPLVPRDDADDQAFVQARQRALKHPLVAGQLLSNDGTTTLLSARLVGKAVSTAEIRPTVEQIGEVVDGSIDGSTIRASITGLPQLRADIYDCIQREEIKFTAVGVIVAVVIATLLFRRPVAVLIVCLPPAVGTLWTLGVLGLVGESINSFNSILPTLVMVVGFTDAVHFMMDIRRGQAQGLTPKEAAAVSLRHLALPCFLTSVTTAVGFGSLIVAQIDVIQRFGMACAAGAVLNFFAVVPLVAISASTRLGKYLADGNSQSSTEARAQRFLVPIIGWITHHAKLITAAACLVTVALVLLTLRLEPDNRIYNGIPAHSSSYRSLQHCDEVFGGALYTYVVVDWPEGHDLDSPQVLKALADVHNVLGRPDELGTPFSILNLLMAIPHRKNRVGTGVKYLDSVPEDVVGRLVRRKLRKAVVNVQTPDLGARALAPVYATVDAELRQLEEKYPGFRLSLTGSTVVGSRNVNLMIVDLARSLALAAVVIFAVISVSYRSVRIGLISILPNALPLAGAAVVLLLRGGALEVAAVTTFSICLGIAVDDTIHLISRYCIERQQTRDTHEAITRAASKVGVALTVTTLTLVGGFGAGLLSELPAIRLFSLLASVALITALAAGVLILPALLLCFDGGASSTRQTDAG